MATGVDVTAVGVDEAGWGAVVGFGLGVGFGVGEGTTVGVGVGLGPQLATRRSRTTDRVMSET